MLRAASWHRLVPGLMIAGNTDFVDYVGKWWCPHATEGGRVDCRISVLGEPAPCGDQR